LIWRCDNRNNSSFLNDILCHDFEHFERLEVKTVKFALFIKSRQIDQKLLLEPVLSLYKHIQLLDTFDLLHVVLTSNKDGDDLVILLNHTLLEQEHHLVLARHEFIQNSIFLNHLFLKQFMVDGQFYLTCVRSLGEELFESFVQEDRFIVNLHTWLDVDGFIALGVVRNDRSSSSEVRADDDERKNLFELFFVDLEKGEAVGPVNAFVFGNGFELDSENEVLKRDDVA